MKLKTLDLFNITLLLIISSLLVVDLFVNRGQPATFDGPTHLTNIAHFANSIRNWEIPVTWTDGFANYGMPLGLMAQQTTSYLGGAMNLLFQNTILSYNVVYFIGAVLSAVLFYYFLRLYFNPDASLAGSVLFTLAPYRIINIYIRGALPEFFASVFLPVIFIGFYSIFNKQRFKGFALATVGSGLLILTHPMMFLVSSFLFLPYLLFLFWRHQSRRLLFLSGAAVFLGLLLAGYYVFPLVAEIKYFYYGLEKNHFALGQSMGLQNFLDPRWYYFWRSDTFTRGHFIKSGLIETVILFLGIVGLGWNRSRKKKNERDWLAIIFIAVAGILIVLMSPIGIPLYQISSLLGGTQHQWRLFSAFIFIPPFILAFFLDKTGKKWAVFLAIILICVVRFPQLYGKNYVLHPDRDYLFSAENLHGNVLNTLWTGPTQDYPIKAHKGEIIEGKGTLVTKSIKNTRRIYFVDTDTKLRLVDYTFYFPGWHALIDGGETTIEFQDPHYRGVITYFVPKGKHYIEVVFKPTKQRFFGYVLSAAGVVIFLGSFLFRKKFQKF
ncbi:glycosyltransferase family 39 protein [Candidatus Roizmanbacteria bacterium]|nr:glycosyltransferase family 39 protein [Candidatus Roizmanbacteria bacterium]